MKKFRITRANAHFKKGGGYYDVGDVVEMSESQAKACSDRVEPLGMSLRVTDEKKPEAKPEAKPDVKSDNK